MRLDRRTVVLRFERPCAPCPDGEYALRGGICWPTVVDDSGRMEGFAVCLGRQVASGVAYVLAQRPFVVVDHVTDKAGRIEFEGLSTWFNDCWAQYFCDLYAWRQPWETNRRYLLQVIKSAMIQPKPHLIELDWDDDASARLVVAEQDSLGRLAYEPDSDLARQLGQYSVAPPQVRDRFPAVHALTCALFALETAVPRDPKTGEARA